MKNFILDTIVTGGDKMNNEIKTFFDNDENGIGNDSEFMMTSYSNNNNRKSKLNDKKNEL